MHNISEDILNPTMIKRKYFIFNDVQYPINDYYVVINGENCTVEYYMSNEIGNVYFMYRKPNNSLKSTNYYASQTDVDGLIERVTPRGVKIERGQEYDSPDAISFEAGIAWYVVVMLAGLIFKDRWIIWIVATIVFLVWQSAKPRFKNGGSNQ